jgi:hypothetical protein
VAGGRWRVAGGGWPVATVGVPGSLEFADGFADGLRALLVGG